MLYSLGIQLWPKAPKECRHGHHCSTLLGPNNGPKKRAYTAMMLHAWEVQVALCVLVASPWDDKSELKEAPQF